MKRLLFSVLTLCLLAPAVVAQEKAPAPEPEIHKMADGLQIQCDDIRTLRDDTAEMLGIFLWKIRLFTPEKGKSLAVKLELRTPGEKPQQFGGFGATPFQKGDYIFGLQPMGGDSNFIDTAPKIRLYSRTSSYWAGNEDKSPGNSHALDNPFLRLGSPSFPYLPPVRADGSILLLQFSQSGKADDPKNSELVVVATLQDPPLAK